LTTTEQNIPEISQPAPNIRGRHEKALLWAALSGLLLVGAFPHLDWGWLSWVALIPFLRTFPHRRMRDAVGVGFVLGLVFFAGLWYWMGVFAGHVIGPALSMVIWLGAALSQTVTIMVFAVGAQVLSSKTNLWAWRLGVPALWAALEWARQFGVLGTDWGDLAYTQHLALVILQTTKLAGVFGLSFLIVLVNVALTELMGGTRRFPLAVGGVVLAALVYGGITLHAENLHPTFVAAALQADVNQDVKWTPQYAQNTLAAFESQAQEASRRDAKLVVWPETGFPGYLSTDPALREQASLMAIQNHEAMLVGTVDYDEAEKKNANSLFLVQADGTLGGSYRKQRLVPFGEYVPYRGWLPFLGKLQLTIYDMVPGEARQPVLDVGPPVGPVGTAICYDSTDGEIMRRQVAGGADLLVVSTDDTWFGHTAAARQHAACSAVRAAEEDRYLVRCAATGISQVIDPTGRVLTEAGLFTQRVVSAPVQARHDITPYARWGDWFVAVCAAGFAVCLLPWGERRAGRHQV
jgi:apolipoprotein N-acyltransferase